MENLLIISLLSFLLSFVFALGGVGSAIALVPLLNWLGIPLNQAKATGLFINTISMSGASVANVRAGRLDLRLGAPVIVASILLAPLGAYLSTLISTKLIMLVFTLFLVSAGLIMLFFHGTQQAEPEPGGAALLLVAIGSLAGFLSGLLGVGGGAVISPLMVLMGYPPKKVTTITAFTVPFSSLAGFLAYWAMGRVEAALLLCGGLAAYAGGYLGTHFMQSRLRPAAVKRFLALLILLIAVRVAIRI